MSPGPNSGGGPGPGPLPFPFPSAEPLTEFLVRRERELTQQIDALRGQITPKEQEREQVRTAMRALGLLNALDEIKPASPHKVFALPPSNSGHTPPSGDFGAVTFTIKQMALSALRDHFRDGATPVELRDYMKTAFGRDVDRNSISPQLARLREQGAVQQHYDGKWSITSVGRLYNHPRSFDASRDEPVELNEESSDEDIARWIATKGYAGKISISAMREQLRKGAKFKE